MDIDQHIDFYKDTNNIIFEAENTGGVINPFEVEDMFIIHLFNEKIDYVNKYKNSNSYVLFKDYILKAKTKHYTMFQALDLSEQLKETYTLWQSR